MTFCESDRSQKCPQRISFFPNRKRTHEVMKEEEAALKMCGQEEAF